MNSNDLYEKAKQLVELTGITRNYKSGSRLDVPSEGPLAEHQRMMSELQIELRTKHMSSDQLDALLEFYCSEMGQSILEAQERIRLETSEFQASLVKNNDSGSIGVRIDSKGDT